MKKLNLLVMGLFLLVAVFSLTLLTIFVFSSLSSPQVSDPIENFRYDSFNTITNERTHGVVSMLPNTFEGDFLSYKSGSSHILISSFDSSQYKCSGKCSCTNSNRRSSAVSLLSHLFFFVASSSMAGAFIVSKNLFREECVTRFQDTCPPDSIEVDIEECKSVGAEKVEISTYESEDDPNYVEIDESFDEENFLEKTKKVDLNDNNSEEKEFSCFGKCVTILDRKSKKEFLMLRSDLERGIFFDDCDEFELRLFINVRTPNPKLLKSLWLKKETQYAAWQFVKDHLNPFCEEKGLVWVAELSHDQLRVCAGMSDEGNYRLVFNTQVFDPKRFNPTIECISYNEEEEDF